LVAYPDSPPREDGHSRVRRFPFISRPIWIVVTAS
jgi:hypothetical protein